MDKKFLIRMAFFAMAIMICNPANHLKAAIIHVPSDFLTVALAVQNANSGDTIILSPGNYSEQKIGINIPITISSEWILTGDEAKIDATVITVPDVILFSLNSDDVEISGLKILNGNHTLDINARATIKYNHMVNNLDPISMETGGGGYVGYNLLENNRDDGIDLDIGISASYTGSDIVIEHNTIKTSADDGIEIRLFDDPNQNIHYEIRHNTITGSKRAGIQLISYDVYTGKIFDIHHNVIKNCKAGLGCMGGSNTTEDLGGAPLMDEKVFLYNNTLLENEMGATGGNNMYAINNVVANNTAGGFKLFGDQSGIANNLFFNNNGNHLIEISGAATQSGNILNEDPILSASTSIPAITSPCVDAGLKAFIMNEITVIEISAEEYTGSAPDIGAMENNGETGIAPFIRSSDRFHIQNVPNPFRTKTDIILSVPGPCFVKVDIYDMTGRHIQTLDEGIRSQGMHTLQWTGADGKGNSLPGGIYIAMMSTGSAVSQTKMLLLH